MDARTRLGWVRLYEQLGNAGVVCRRCGISRPTLRKWWRRYQAEGEAGLETRSHRPHTSPGRKVFDEQEALILRLRRERKLGIKMLRNELARRHGLRSGFQNAGKLSALCIRVNSRPFPVPLAPGGGHGEGDGVGGGDHRPDRGPAAQHRTTTNADD
jgi:transposase-like protein